MSDWVENLNQIKNLADEALAALADEHEGNFRNAVETLDKVASRLRCEVDDM